jgi:hypothetical protein
MDAALRHNQTQQQPVSCRPLRLLDFSPVILARL